MSAHFLALSLRLVISEPSESQVPVNIYAGSVVFTTPEAPPTQAPQVTAANLQKNKITINWLLTERCPGFIRFYDIKILCDALPTSDLQSGNSGNISFDCSNA